jgi:hypothetical protein
VEAGQTAIPTAFSGDAMIPLKNASSLADLRSDGMAPELPILVSFIGPLNGFTNTVLAGDPAASHDWRPIMGLDVEVFASSRIAFPRIVQQLAGIAAAVPKRLLLTFDEGPRVDCGERRIVRDGAGDFWLFDWLPMAIGPVAYAGGRVVARRLWDAIASGDIPTPFDRAAELVVEIATERHSCA